MSTSSRKAHPFGFAPSSFIQIRNVNLELRVCLEGYQNLQLRSGFIRTHLVNGDVVDLDRRDRFSVIPGEDLARIPELGVRISDAIIPALEEGILVVLGPDGIEGWITISDYKSAGGIC